MKPWMHAAALCLAAVAGPAWAQDYLPTYTPETVVNYRLASFGFNTVPVAGVYQDFGQPGSGTGWGVDTVAAGNQIVFFGAFYLYRPDGQPTWLVVNAPLQQSSVAEFKASALPAFVQSPLYYGVNGPCIDCPSTANTLLSLPSGARRLEVWSGTQLRLPQLNGEAPLNPQLARQYRTTSRWQELVAGGEVWALQTRTTVSGLLQTRYGGWVRFGRRAPAKHWDYVGRTGTRIQDGQGGFLPATMPDWLDIADKNSIPEQHELVCVYRESSASGTVGACDAIIGVEPTDRWDVDLDTWLIDPATDRLHYIRNTVQGTSFYRDNGLVQAAGRMFESGTDAEGNPRMILRVYSLNVDGFWIEVQFTRVPLALVQAKVPGYVPTGN